MNKLPCWIVCVVVVALAFVGCQKADNRSQEKVYDIKGKVVSVDTDGKTLTLDHEDIPGLMKGMEMQFKVDNAQTLQGVAPGDQVQGRLKVDSGNYLISDLEKQ